MASIDVSALNRQGKVFVGANVSAKSVIAVTTAMTGLILWNPPSSNKKLILIDFGFVWTTVPGAVHNIGLAVQSATTVLPTTLTVAGRSATAADGSGNVGAGIVWDAATVVTPVAVRWFNGTLATGGVGNYQANDRVDGSVVVVPGAAVMLTVVTTTAVGMGHFTWAEVNA
jgi:hypothetical protein